jgi:hypothetical protein
VLGLTPRFDLGMDVFDVNLLPGSLPGAAGRLPIPGGAIDIEWTRAGEGIDYRLRAPRPIQLRLPPDARGVRETAVIAGDGRIALPRR